MQYKIEVERVSNKGRRTLFGKWIPSDHSFKALGYLAESTMYAGFDQVWDAMEYGPTKEDAVSRCIIALGNVKQRQKWSDSQEVRVGTL